MSNLPSQIESTDAEIAEELNNVGSELFLDLIAEKARLLDFEYQLNRARAGSCVEVARPQFGILTGSAETLNEEWLEDVAARSNILADELTIVHVVPGSAFDLADLRIGDELLEIDGQEIGSHSDLVQFRMRSGGVSSIEVRYRRTDREHTIRIPVEQACPTRFELVGSESLMTFTRLSVTFVPRGLMAYAKDDDVLAAALAHGMSHALYDKPKQPVLENERRADLLGIETAALAGFDVRKTVRYWEDMAKAYPYVVIPHPSKRGTSKRTWNKQAWSEARRGYPHYDVARRFRAIRIAIAHRSPPTR